MTKVLKTSIKEFKFIDETRNWNDITNIPHYNIKIIVKELEYENKKICFDITYKYKFIKSDDISNFENDTVLVNAHPFQHNIESADGDIIIKNAMTEKMIEYLLMDENELVKESGYSTAQRYRVNIMNSIALFWD